jgi:putative membrane protein
MIQIVHHTRRRLLQGFAGAVLLGSAATAQSAVPAAEFVRQTAIAQMFGIESATLALHKSNSPAIKDFAHALASEQGAVTSGLRRIIAKRSDIALPDRPDGRHLDLLRDLTDKQGPAFDKAYVEAQRSTHHDVAVLMERYANEGDDAELKSFAAQTLPVFRELERKSRELAVAP